MDRCRTGTFREQRNLSWRVNWKDEYGNTVADVSTNWKDKYGNIVADVSTNWKDKYGNTVAQLSRAEFVWFDITNYFMMLLFAMTFQDPVPAISC
jgi:hypothetical protein